MNLKMSFSKGLFRLEGKTSKLEKAGSLDKWKHNKVDGFFTHNLLSASLLRDYADERAKNIIDRSLLSYTPWEGSLFIPKGLKALPHQPGAARFSLSRNRSYLALSPGLGKTIVAALMANAIGGKSVITVPPFLTLNTLEEFTTWAPKLKVKILDNVDWVIPDVLIVPDSQLTNPYVKNYIEWFEPILLTIDEAHRFVNDSQRTRALLGFFDGRKKKNIKGFVDIPSLKNVTYMSGTPILNRPIEIFPILRKSAGQYINFMDKNQFGLKYCNAYRTQDNYGNFYGYDLTGCNKKTFKNLMKRVKAKDDNDPNGFMLRLTKDILGLPPMTEEIVILSEDMPRALKSMNVEMMKKFSPKDLIKMELARSVGRVTEDELHLMEYRKLLGIHKVKSAVEYIKGILEDTEDNLLIIGVHKEVMFQLEEKLSKFRPFVITGKTNVNKRQGIAKEYQKSKNRRIMLGQAETMVGLNLQKANRVPLVEYLYSPMKNLQGIDRAHRYLQTKEVLASYLCFRNSLDCNVIKTLVHKTSITALV